MESHTCLCRPRILFEALGIYVSDVWQLTESYAATTKVVNHMGGCAPATRDKRWLFNMMQLADMAPPHAPVLSNGNVPGVFVRGTLRMPREQLFDVIQANLKQRFGERHAGPLVTF